MTSAPSSELLLYLKSRVTITLTWDNFSSPDDDDVDEEEEGRINKI
jgi:hypothetical protein